MRGGSYPESERQMNILQIASSYGQACGIGNFSQALERALAHVGIHVHTVNTLTEGIPPAQMTLIHHDWDLFENDDEAVRSLCLRSPQPVILFVHTGPMHRAIGAERFADVVDGFICMSIDVVTSVKPVFIFPHPATFIPDALEDHNTLRDAYGLPRDTLIIGSSGFLRIERQFPQLLSLLLPHMKANNWFIDLITSRWFKSSPQLQHIEHELDHLAQKFPGNFRYGTSFLHPIELNRHLQACNLLWCWTDMPSTSYASGSISDQYACGTRLYLVEKQQHQHILSLPNVVAGPPQLDDFANGLIAELHRGYFPRHDPSLVSWHKWTEPFAVFLRQIQSQYQSSHISDQQIDETR
jgi:hypothetical protein